MYVIVHAAELAMHLHKLHGIILPVRDCWPNQGGWLVVSLVLRTRIVGAHESSFQPSNTVLTWDVTC